MQRLWPEMSLPLLILCLIPLAGCSTVERSDIRATAGVATSAACTAFTPILWSSHDTLETQQQARRHNAVGASLCGWKP